METRVMVIKLASEPSALEMPDYGYDMDVAQLIEFWKRNKYPLLAVNRRNADVEIFSSPEFVAAREKELALHNGLRAEYVLVRDGWAQAGIDCMLIKSGGLEPSFPYLSDNLDVLVRPENEAKARAILRDMGYIELRNIEEPKKFLFRKFSGGRSVSAIHLHTQVGWLVGFMDEKSLWERYRVSSDDPAVSIPSPEDSIMITLAHSFYENKRFRLSDIARVRECWSRNDIDWDYMELVARQRGWLIGLYFCSLVVTHVEKRLWGKTAVPHHRVVLWQNAVRKAGFISHIYQEVIKEDVIKLPLTFSFMFSKRLYYHKVWHDQTDSLGKKLFYTAQTLGIGLKLKSGIRPRPSLLVTFSGPDGSGKTQLARTLEEALITSELKPRYYWNRCSTTPLARLLNTIGRLVIKHHTGMATAVPGAAGRRERLGNPVLRFLWSYLNAFDMVLAYLFQVRLPLLTGRIVICDRYVYDAAAEMIGSLKPGDRTNRVAVKLMLALAPKPDKAFFLDVPAEVCARRKQDNTDPGYLRRQRRIYLALAKRHGLLTTKTDRDFLETAGEIIPEVMTPYLDNFDTWLNGVFLANHAQLNQPGKE